MEEKGDGKFPVLETERLILRKISMDDLEDMYEYGSSDEVSAYVSWPTHQSMEDTKRFVETVLEEYSRGVLPVFWGIVLKTSQKLIGTINYVSWKPKHQTGEIGYVLSRHYWGQGFMPEAAEKVLEYGFCQLGLIRVQARCFVENTGSEKVMQKVGMTHEGTMRKAMFAKGRHWDLRMYSVLADEFGVNKK
ncbi:GNAT family N-acetyltransferase [Virgibacillus siamensis]|uniref:GNAT family N-acetyltransferase n=1 Tax=Virgibacillus siamensis TaxID=480071 RepID=A0ABN1FNH1_9BACI